MITQWLFGFPLLYLAVYDYKTHIIPDRIVFPLALLAFATCSPRGIGYFESLEGACAGITVLLLTALLSRGKTGFGDVKLAGVLGLLLGVIPSLFCLFVTFVGISIFAKIKRLPPQTAIPMAPFFALGFIVSLLTLPY